MPHKGNYNAKATSKVGGKSKKANSGPKKVVGKSKSRSGGSGRSK